MLIDSPPWVKWTTFQVFVNSVDGWTSFGEDGDMFIANSSVTTTTTTTER
jgi:hypothetical protein